MNLNTTFTTENLSLSAFLLTNNCIILDVVSDGPRHYLFSFKDQTRCEELVKNFYAGGTCPARDLLSNRRKLINYMKYGFQQNIFTERG